MPTGKNRKQPAANQWGVILAVVAVADAVLGFLAVQAKGNSFLQTVLALGTIILLLVCLWVVVQLAGAPARRVSDDEVTSGTIEKVVEPLDPGPGGNNTIKYDLFIGTPMDSLDKQSYERHRQ